MNYVCSLAKVSEKVSYFRLKMKCFGTQFDPKHADTDLGDEVAESGPNPSLWALQPFQGLTTTATGPLEVL